MANRSLVNAYDAVQAMAVSIGPDLAFSGSTVADYQAWRQSFLAAYGACLGPWPQPAHPETEIAESVDCGSHTRLRLYFNSTPNVTASAYVLVPTNIAPGERRPGVLACHGHGNGKDDVVGLNPDSHARRVDHALQAVERGYVVMVPDWLPFGERRPPKEWWQGCDCCNVTGLAWQYFGYTLQAQNVWDGMRALDVLIARPDVDAERLAVLGSSYGGTMALHLAVNDPRLKAAAVSCYLSTVREDAITTRGQSNFCGAQHVPGLLLHGDIAEMAGLIAPKPLLIIAGQRDDCFIVEDVRRAYSRLARIYAAAGCADRLEYNEHDGPHGWRGDYAWPWLERNL